MVDGTTAEAVPNWVWKVSALTWLHTQLLLLSKGMLDATSEPCVCEPSLDNQLGQLTLCHHDWGSDYMVH